jgi:hypothetical protein
VGIQEHMKEDERTCTIHIGVWTGSSGAIRISGTQSMHSSNYQYDRKRHNIGEVNSTDGNGRRHDFGRISPSGIEIKGQILA